jgi:hypothetical protein
MSCSGSPTFAPPSPEPAPVLQRHGCSSTPTPYARCRTLARLRSRAAASHRAAVARLPRALARRRPSRTLLGSHTHTASHLRRTPRTLGRRPARSLPPRCASAAPLPLRPSHAHARPLAAGSRSCRSLQRAASPPRAPSGATRSARAAALRCAPALPQHRAPRIHAGPPVPSRSCARAASRASSAALAPPAPTSRALRVRLQRPSRPSRAPPTRRSPPLLPDAARARLHRSGPRARPPAAARVRHRCSRAHTACRRAREGGSPQGAAAPAAEQREGGRKGCAARGKKKGDTRGGIRQREKRNREKREKELPKDSYANLENCRDLSVKKNFPSIQNPNEEMPKTKVGEFLKLYNIALGLKFKNSKLVSLHVKF